MLGSQFTVHGLRLTARGKRSGLTLVELIVAFAILLILSTMALPLARVKVQREKERLLRQALAEVRKAIDRYKDTADAGKLGPIEQETHGYPPNLELLVEGVTTQPLGPVGTGLPQSQQQRPPGPGGRGLAQSQQRGFGQSTGGFGSQTQAPESDSSGEPQKIRFLRRIPVDPMTDTSDWGLRSVQDDPDSMSWGGQNVFDVYSKSMDTALDGTKYSDW